jgi:hypothetical protein
VVGYCTGISIAENIEYQPIDPIDSIHTIEHSEVAYRVNGTLDFVRIVNLSAVSKGYWSKLQDMIQGLPELTMVVQDSVTESVLYTVIGWKPETKNFRVEGRTLAGENVTWVGQVVLDEFAILDPPQLSPT